MTVDIEAFKHAYIECALWCGLQDEDGEPLDNYFADDLSADALRQMHADCEDFVISNRALLEQSELTPEQAGHDFWLTRNGHGAGFWDRGIGAVGDELSDMARAYGAAYLYVGDDGRVYHQ